MSLNTRFWIQIAGVLFFAGVTIAEATGLKAPTFGLAGGWAIFAGAVAVMAFEAWRTRRKMNTETDNGPDEQGTEKG